MTETVKNVRYIAPLLGNTTDNPLYIDGSGGETISGVANATSVADLTAQQLAIETLLVLKKIEYHLSLMTDADLEHTNL